jgi:AcrR family transcriptional regulator
VAVRGRVRQDLSAAAIELFLSRGYEETTADEIAEAAGVARRTFFRHFRTKEDAVFPDHDTCLTRVRAFIESAGAGEPGLAVTGRAAHLVLAMYTDDRATAVRRYELTRRVEALREREITTTSRYQRVFADYMHRRAGGRVREETRLRNEVAAAAVVAAHNQILRQWLRRGGTGDPHARLDEALRSVSDLLGPWLAEGRAAGVAAGSEDEVVVVVLPRGTPMWRVVQQVEAAAPPLA